MAKTYTHPHWEITVIDKSIYTPLNREILPLHRPIFFCRAQKGPVGVPMWCYNATEANDTFGIGTFDETTKWYSREAIYMNQLFIRQGCFITRMASADAQYGSLVLELRVKNVDVPQWQKDANGQFILDPTTSERMPLLDNGVQVSEPGLELKWQVRPLTLTGNRTETITNLKPTTYGTGPGSYTIYPILAMKAKSVGEYANDIGIKFFVALDGIDDTLASNISCLPYTFGVVQKTYGQDTVSAVMNNFQEQYANVILKPEQQDTRVARNVSFDDIMGNEYDGKLDMDIHLYSDNVEAVGKLIQDVEPDDDTLYSPWMANLAEPYNIEDVPYSHVVLSDDDDNIYLNETRILYMQGGSDGSIDDKSIEALTVQYLDDLVYPELMEQPRYPFTHMYDTGVQINTKYSFIRFLGKHDAFKLVLSTTDCSINKTCGFTW